jgi:hypothetical protein
VAEPPEPEEPEIADAVTDPGATAVEEPPPAPVRSPAWDDLRVTTEAPSEADRTAPDWHEGDRIDFTAPVTRSLAPSPPLPAEAARAALAAVVATRRSGSRLDLDWMIDRASRLQPVAPPRLLVEARTAPVVWLLIDRGEGMEPYAADTWFLATELVAVAGTERVERHTFVGTPARGLDPNPFTGAVGKWVPPPERALLVVLSDLGAGALDVFDAASEAEWAGFARGVEEAGATLRALTPFGRERQPAAVAHAAQWESLTEVTALRA